MAKRPKIHWVEGELPRVIDRAEVERCAEGVPTRHIEREEAPG
jgi:hypothetical protein